MTSRFDPGSTDPSTWSLFCFAHRSGFQNIGVHIPQPCRVDTGNSPKNADPYIIVELAHVLTRNCSLLFKDPRKARFHFSVFTLNLKHCCAFDSLEDNILNSKLLNNSQIQPSIFELFNLNPILLSASMKTVCSSSFIILTEG